MLERLAVVETKIDNLENSFETKLGQINNDVKTIASEVHKIRLEFAGKQGMLTGIAIGVSLAVSTIATGVIETGKHVVDFFRS